MLRAYPVPDETKIDRDAEANVQWTKLFILGIRKIKAEMNIKPSQQVDVLLVNATVEDMIRCQSSRAYLDFLAKTKSITELNADDPEPESAIALVGTMKVLIPLEGLIDRDAEIARLDREIEKLEKEQIKINVKLENPNFVQRAPKQVVEKEQDRLTELNATTATLIAQRQRILGA